MFTEKKLSSAISHKEKLYSAMAHLFACDSSNPSFNIFRSDLFSKLTQTISGENEVKTLKIPHLKMRIDLD